MAVTVKDLSAGMWQRVMW